MKSKFGIVSYSDKLILPTSLNHQFYADQHRYTYILDISPCPTLANKTIPLYRQGYFSKIQKVRKFLPLFDWVMWIDDDVVFTNSQVQLESIVAEYPQVDFLICNSPVNQKGESTFVNSGVFLVRNTPRALDFLDACLVTDFESLSTWWDPAKLGTYTNADQDAMLYNLIQNSQFDQASGFWSRIDYKVMNSRIYHYNSSPDEHFILHLAGVADKAQALIDFSEKFGVHPLIVPDDIPNQYRYRSAKSSNPNKPLNLFEKMRLFLEKIKHGLKRRIK